MTTPQDTDEATERTPRHWPWWAPWTAALALAAIVIGVGSWVVLSENDTGDSGGMGNMGAAAGALPPPVTGYYDGERIQFLHTETSDAEVADMLTDMMGGSPVIHTPSLAEVNGELLAPVYVFTNGIQPGGARGPFGFQPDVFTSVPGDPGYTPLRSVHLVEWQPDTQPHLLTTAPDIQQARAAGDVTVSEPGIVVNMPITTWPGGQR